MFIKIRHWLIRQIAGKMSIVLNADVIHGILHVDGNCGALVYGCCIEPVQTPEGKEVVIRLRRWIDREWKIRGLARP